jgi:alanyl-tRNA synthetase
MDANGLRRAFTGFFVDRGHTPVASAGLIPHHPRAPLFTNAGMNQFIPYFLGEEQPPFTRATSVQRCVRVRGKHDDIELIGRTNRHLSFFEMLGNFSFGDYFKADAIAFAWELLTDVLGLDGDRLWVTVHPSDDEAAAVWRDGVGLAAERIQTLEDNFWEMGETGPCGPCSEIHYDKGEAFGPGGGPSGNGPDGDGGERYLEIWNLVFTQYDRLADRSLADRSLADLPRRNIDTGAGLERILPLLQGVDTVWDTDALRPVIAAAESVTGRSYGDDPEVDVSLRVLADHGRCMTFLVNDGAFPSNEDRGYVVRRIIRRAVRQAFQLGVAKSVTPALVTATADVMGEAYPELGRNAGFITGVVEREEERFRRTLTSGSSILEEQLAGGEPVSGEVAFRLHDTYGFPIDLTREMAAEHDVEVDLEGFHVAMDEQRRRGRRAGAGSDDSDAGGLRAGPEEYRELLEQFGTTEFSGYGESEAEGRVLAVAPAGDGRVEIFLDRTPFYAEGGGQVGDTGTIRTGSGQATVVDTTSPLPGLHRHLAIVEGELHPGQEAVGVIDIERRASIRRNHTGTHLLHWALREVLGPHVKQQGSLVAPDYLRFDFSHFSGVSDEDLERVQHLVNEQVLANEPVRAYETSKAHAEEMGALAFFGDKYGDFVRVVEAGPRSVELCGGTHVGALGTVGPVLVTSESSIGSNMRRVFALTGAGSLERVRDEERLLQAAAGLLRSEPGEVPAAVERLLEREHALRTELRSLRSEAAEAEAGRMAARATGGHVVVRRDGLAPDQLRELAVAVRGQPGVQAVVLVGSPDGQRVALVAAVDPAAGIQAASLVGPAARTVGGGGGGKGDVATAGGRDASRIDEALGQVRAQLGAR